MRIEFVAYVVSGASTDKLIMQRNNSLSDVQSKGEAQATNKPPYICIFSYIHIYIYIHIVCL